MTWILLLSCPCELSPDVHKMAQLVTDSTYKKKLNIIKLIIVNDVCKVSTIPSTDR